MHQRLIDLVYKPLLDPDRVRRTFRHFDEDRGFREYNAKCRASFRRAPPPGRSTELTEGGFQYLPVMSPHRAHELAERIRARYSLTPLKKNNTALLGFRVGAGEERRALLEGILDNRDVDGLIAGFFQSEYLVHWMVITQTAPNPEAATVSFRWHCDKGPPDHLKLIVYLNGTDEHGGNTEFIRRPDTDRVAARGYIFGRTRQRTHDIDELSRIAEKPISSHREPIAAGGGVLFQPARVLHRALLPNRAPRLAITVCLLPSPVHWREALELEVTADLAVDEKWPRHAQELMAALGRAT